MCFKWTIIYCSNCPFCKDLIFCSLALFTAPPPVYNSLLNMWPYKCIIDECLMVICFSSDSEQKINYLKHVLFENSSILNPTNLKYVFVQSVPIFSRISFPIFNLQFLGSKCIFLFLNIINFVLKTFNVKRLPETIQLSFFVQS